MRRLLSAEFYKLWKSVGFRVCLIVFFVQDVIYLLSVGFVGDLLGMELNGFEQFNYLLTSFSGSTVSGMLFGFMAASLITSDYKSRDIQCAIAQGHSRIHIMFSKIIVYVVAIWILAAEDILVYIVGSSIVGGFGRTFDGDVALYMLRSIACEGFVLTMMFMTCVFVAFSLTSKAASVSINILLFFVIDLGLTVMPLIFQSEKLEKFLSYLPFVAVNEMGEWNIDWGHAGIAMGIAAVYGVAMIVATWTVFRRRDLR